MTALSFPFRIIITKTAGWLAIALLVFGPVSFLILDHTGGVIWALTVLAGFAVACTTFNKWWPEIREQPLLLLCFGILALYLVLPVLSYFLVDSSDFAASRVKRQLLFLGTPFVFLLLWRLRPPLQTVLALIAINASAFGAYSLWFLAAHPGRVDGVTHAVHFGNVSLFLGSASLALLLITRHSGWRILGVAGMILGGSALVLSGSRGAWIAVPVLCVIALIAAIRTLGLRRHMIFGLVSLIILILAGLWHTEAVQTRVVSAQKDLEQLSRNHWQHSIGFRIIMWEQAWLEIREAPLRGTGFSGYRNRVYSAVRSGALPKEMLRFATEPHNEYLYQWVTRGAVGIMLFLLCLVGAGWYFFRLLLRGNHSQVAVAHVGLSLVITIAVGGLTITFIDQRAVIRLLVWIVAVLIYSVWLLEKDRPVRKALED